MIRRLLHSISHLPGWNTGEVETWHEGGRLMVGFRCAGCGELQGVDEASEWIARQ